MDVARAALRLGAENVSVVSRRGRDEMPASDEEDAALVLAGDAELDAFPRAGSEIERLIAGLLSSSSVTSCPRRRRT